MNHRFLCDQMLHGLGRWLRVAGYDTVIIEQSLPDKEVFRTAKEEGRLLVTRDRYFQQMGDQSVVYLRANTIEECVKEMTMRLNLDWNYRPFSRCLICNTLLVEPSSEKVLEQVPQDVQRRSEEYKFCPKCDKVYWWGSHTKRMLKKLELWKFIPDSE